MLQHFQSRPSVLHQIPSLSNSTKYGTHNHKHFVRHCFWSPFKSYRTSKLTLTYTKAHLLRLFLAFFDCFIVFGHYPKDIARAKYQTSLATPPTLSSIFHCLYFIAPSSRTTPSQGINFTKSIIQLFSSFKPP